MRFPLRGSGRLPGLALVRTRLNRRPEQVSQENIRRFLREARSRPPVRFPDTPPRTLAIVVSCYKHRAYLPATLASIASQTRLPDEVVLVDDASEDGSSEVLRAWLASQPWLTGEKGKLVVHERNLGQAASLNEAIGMVRSELAMVLNSDDYLLHDAVAVTLRRFAEHPELGLAGAHSIGFSGEDFLAQAPKLSTDYEPEPVPLTIQRPEQVSAYRGYNDLNMTHSGSCFRKLAWEAVGGYRPRQERCVPFSDRDLQIRINALFPVGIAYETPLSFWRTDSSVDRGRDS